MGERVAGMDDEYAVISRYIAVLRDRSEDSIFVPSDPAFRRLYEVHVYGDGDTYDNVPIEIMKEVL